MTLAARPLTQSTALWLVLRLLAGVDSAAVFVIAVSSLLGHLREHPAHLPGWSFGGVGIGIALTAGYSAGQILRALVVTPLLHNGYHQALLSGAGVVLAAAVAAGVLRVRFPRRP